MGIWEISPGAAAVVLIDMMEPLVLIGLAVAWIVLVRYVLPRAGVPT